MTTVYDMIAEMEQDSERALADGAPTRAIVYELRALRTVLTLISAQVAGIGEPREDNDVT